MVEQLSFLKSKKFTLLLAILFVSLSLALFNSFKVHAQTASPDPSPVDQILNNFDTSSQAVIPSPSSSPSAHLNDIFLKIDGIAGESTDKTHINEIVIDSFSFGVSQTGASTGLGAGKAKINEFHITKAFDKSSPELFLASASGKHIKDMTLAMRKAGGDPQSFLTIKLTDVLVSSYNTFGSGDGVHDSISFVFSKIEIEYRPQKSDGSLGEPVKAGWDVKANKKI